MPSTPSLKLHAYLAQLGLGSRRQMETWVQANRVKVNGEVAHVGQRVSPGVDQIMVDGKPVGSTTETKLMYFLVNKPVGLITTTSDELDRSNVLKLLPNTTERVYPVGRLDKDSQGLLLITNDGQLAYQLTHPKFGITKTYEVRLDRAITTKAIDFLRKGTHLKDGFSKPESVTRLDLHPTNQWLSITIHEGRNHHVRRMVQRAGYRVMELVRTRFGPFELDELGDKPYLELDATTVQQRLSGYRAPSSHSADA